MTRTQFFGKSGNRNTEIYRLGYFKFEFEKLSDRTFLFLIADTCQSESMYQRVYSPNVLATSSSLIGEDSLSYDVDHTNRSMQDYFRSCPHSKCLSTVGVRTDLYPKVSFHLVPLHVYRFSSGVYSCWECCISGNF
uniref:GPI-anchor transamidase n=1 Tax=Parascaris equorum TaxID=6256 RepID=A0A914R8J9_PAREQ